MPTIKRKVEMNLPQFIEWGWNNKELSKNKRFISKNKGNLAIKQSVIFNHFSYAEIENNYCYGPEDTFTVEVEEEITEDTVIPRLLTTFKKIYLKDDFGYQRVRIDEDFKIQLMLNKAEAHREKIETLHMVNDDGTHTLLWRDGKLVE